MKEVLGRRAVGKIWFVLFTVAKGLSVGKLSCKPQRTVVKSLLRQQSEMVLESSRDGSRHFCSVARSRLIGSSNEDLLALCYGLA